MQEYYRVRLIKCRYQAISLIILPRFGHLCNGDIATGIALV